MSTSQPVVSFAGPLIHAERALKVAEDLFERGKVPEGLQQLQIVQTSIDQVVEFFIVEDVKKEKAA